MTVAASFDQTRHYPLGVRGAGSYWRRLAILMGLVTADIFCFAVADFILHRVAVPPALASLDALSAAPVTAATTLRTSFWMLSS